MAEQTNLDITIGTTETISLKPTNVKIVDAEIKLIEKAKADKLILRCKHPDKEELIGISEIKTEKKGKLEVTGLWVKKDKEGRLVKNSAAAVLLNNFGCKTPRELIGKELPTVLDERGYLAIKVY